MTEADWISARIAAAEAGGAPVAKAAVEQIETLLRDEFSAATATRSDLSEHAKALLKAVTTVAPKDEARR